MPRRTTISEAIPDISREAAEKEALSLIEESASLKGYVDRDKVVRDKIKSLFGTYSFGELTTDGGVRAKLSTSVSEEIDEDGFVAWCKEHGHLNLIKTVEVLDMDAVETAVYEEAGSYGPKPISEGVSAFTRRKETTRLTITQPKKGGADDGK